MDLGYTEKGLDEIDDLQKEIRPAFIGNLDLNLAVTKEEGAEVYGHENEARGDRIQVDLNQQGQHGSPSLPADFRHERPEYPRKKSNSLVQSDLDLEVVRRRNLDYDRESSQSPLKDNHYQDETEVLCGSYFCKSSSPVKAETFCHEMETEDSVHYARKSPSKLDTNYQGEDTEKDNSDSHRPTFPLLDEEVKVNSCKIPESLQYEKAKSAYEEMEAGATDHCTEKLLSPPMLQYNDDETKGEEFYNMGNPPPENDLELCHSDQHSPGRTSKRSTSPVRQMSFSPERSPYVQKTPGQRLSSSPQGVQDPLYSPRSFQHIPSPSPERSGRDSKRVPSQDHLPSSARRTSTSPLRRSRQDSQRMDDSPLKRLSTSPRRRHSPPNHQRPRSPIRRKDSSSRYRRDSRDKSRSRSPYSRDRHRRSPRRRSSSRHRSSPSGYHSRHRHSPKRRPWSPPPNRNTGVGRPGKNLFVAGFGFGTTERDLERKFSRFGRVRDVRIVRDKRNGSDLTLLRTRRKRARDEEERRKQEEMKVVLGIIAFFVTFIAIMYHRDMVKEPSIDMEEERKNWSGDSRGFGFLSLERDEDADAAIRAIDQTEWNGRIVLVEKSKTSGR
ncbi:hypothetical protein HHK36_005639 [Tetracentron sinense]|uniref:RRM domain-containing protein n=1 Tax=Tetracentron sinense TaxID=13715 RepID=A0A835DN12_TETSI|nr:hypothetical protein HHK36_005639 [Tetracentron sinense]